MSPTPIYDGHRSREFNTAAMTKNQQDVNAVPLARLQIPTPAASISRWSRSTYSMSIYDGDEGSGTTAVEHAPTPSSDEPIGINNQNGTQRKKKRKRDCLKGHSRGTWACIIGTTVFLCLLAVALTLFILGGQLLADAQDRNKDSTPKETTAKRLESSTGSSTTSTTPSSDSASTASAVVQVTTQIIPTTVSTLTESAAYVPPSSVFSSIAVTSASS